MILVIVVVGVILFALIWRSSSRGTSAPDQSGGDGFAFAGEDGSAHGNGHGHEQSADCAPADGGDFGSCGGDSGGDSGGGDSGGGD